MEIRNESADDSTYEISQEELDALKMESDTWALLQALMSYVFSLFPFPLYPTQTEHADYEKLHHPTTPTPVTCLP